MRLQTDVVDKKYRDSLFAAAFQICRNAADADDVVQETLLKYHRHVKEFESEEHLKAWLLRVAVNQAKNVRRSLWRHRVVPIGDYMETLGFESKESENLFAEVMRLPGKYRIVIHLHYYEGYSTAEIAQLLRMKQSTVCTQLERGRKLLKNMLLEADDA